jgi:hypothetical protein
MFLSLHSKPKLKTMKPTDEFLIKLSNLWFYTEPPRNDISDSMKCWLCDMVKMLKYSEDIVFSHPKIKEIVQLCKDFGLIDYEKNIMELYYEGKVRVQTELREMFNSPQVTLELEALSNVLGDLMKEMTKEAKKQIEKEKNISAIPSLKNRDIFKN